MRDLRLTVPSSSLRILPEYLDFQWGPVIPFALFDKLFFVAIEQVRNGIIVSLHPEFCCRSIV